MLLNNTLHIIMFIYNVIIIIIIININDQGFFLSISHSPQFKKDGDCYEACVLCWESVRLLRCVRVGMMCTLM